MYYHNFDIVFQEVPGEISLCFSISGCNMQCPGCHSPFLWKEGNGCLLTQPAFEDFLKQYKSLASCVVFMGGEWHENTLIQYLKLAKSYSYKTCLYTGQNNVSNGLLKELNWIKTGSWKQDLGGLDSPSTNQKFIEVKTNKILNHIFIKNKYDDTPF